MAFSVILLYVHRLVWTYNNITRYYDRATIYEILYVCGLTGLLEAVDLTSNMLISMMITRKVFTEFLILCALNVLLSLYALGLTTILYSSIFLRYTALESHLVLLIILSK